MDTEQWRVFLTALREHFGERAFKVADIVAALDDQMRLSEQPGAGTSLLDALPDELAAKRTDAARSLSKALGIALGKRNGTRMDDDGLRLVRAGKETRSKIALWRVMVDA